MSDITVLTPTISGREKLLAEATASVWAQTLRAAHLVGKDIWHKGVGSMRNELIRAAKTDWVAFLDDDDVLYSNHLEVLASARADADVVYSDCDLVSVQDRQYVKHVKPWRTRRFVLDEIKQRNYIPVTVLARRELLLATPFRPVPMAADWDLWIRLGEAGARFKYVPEVTWMYRRHIGNGASGGNMHEAVALR